MDESANDKVACRAFELYQQRGGEDGHDIEDWLQAEQDLRAAGADAADTMADERNVATSDTGWHVQPKRRAPREARLQSTPAI